MAVENATSLDFTGWNERPPEASSEVLVTVNKPERYYVVGKDGKRQQSWEKREGWTKGTSKMIYWEV